MVIKSISKFNNNSENKTSFMETVEDNQDQH